MGGAVIGLVNGGASGREVPGVRDSPGADQYAPHIGQDIPEKIRRNDEVKVLSMLKQLINGVIDIDKGLLNAGFGSDLDGAITPQLTDNGNAGILNGHRHFTAAMLRDSCGHSKNPSHVLLGVVKGLFRLSAVVREG